MPAGRPTKYRKAMCAQVIKEMSQGASKEAAAGAMGIHKDTLYEYAKVYPEFSDAVKMAEMKCALWWEDKGRKAAQGQIEGFNGTAFVWMTKNILKWTDKMEHTGEGGGALMIKFAKEDEAL